MTKEQQRPAIAIRTTPCLTDGGRAAVGSLVWLVALCAAAANEPPAINPFGPSETGQRADAMAGYLQLSDGTVIAGRLFLTRDARLKVYDTESERIREIPLAAVKRIQCRVEKEWIEKQWRFKENANNEKVYTGHSYPVRQYTHKITLNNGAEVDGPLSAIIYIQPEQSAAPRRFLLHKRQPGPLDTSLESLVYVETIELGDTARERAVRGGVEAGGSLPENSKRE